MVHKNVHICTVTQRQWTWGARPRTNFVRRSRSPSFGVRLISYDSFMQARRKLFAFTF